MSQSSLTVCCPVPTAIASVVTTLNPCVSDVGQIQKLVFWRRGQSIASVATAVIPTTWTTLLAATGDTKAVVSPFVANVELAPGDAREFGGGNETLWGAPIRKGSQSPTFSASMYQEDQDVISALKDLACEALDVVFINEANQLIYSDTRGGVAGFWGFEIANGSFHVSDKGFGGLEDADQNMIMFNLKPNWSDTLEISTETTFALDMINS
jgi:hypothetical protein